MPSLKTMVSRHIDQIDDQDAQLQSSESKVRKRAKIALKELLRIRRVFIGNFPCVKIICPKRSAHLTTNVYLGTLWLKVSPVKKSKNSGGKGSVATLKWSVQLGCVFFKILIRESLFYGQRNIGTVTFSKGTWHHIKIRKGSIARSTSMTQSVCTNI